MKLSILCVTYQSEDVIENLLLSLDKQKIEFECIVCDNNSNDKTKEILLKNKKIRVFFMKRNKGFSRANNFIFKKSKGDIILLLNPDALPLNNALAKGIEFFEKRKDIDVLAPSLKNENGEIYPSVRDFPKFYNLLIPSLWKKRIDYKKEQEVRQPMASALFIKREIYEKLNGFDERFFVYFTDVEFLKRAKEKGYRILYTPQIEFFHKVGKSSKLTKKILVFKSLEWGRGGIRFFFYYGNIFEKLALFPVLWSYTILKSLFYAFL